MPPTVAKPHSWIIEANVRGRRIQPVTEDLVFIKEYPSWDLGITMAMQEALARTLEVYREEISEESTFYVFGRRSLDGTVIRTTGGRDEMCWMATQLEDLEVLVFHMGESLEEEAQRITNAIVNAKAEVRETMEALNKSNLELTFELSEMGHKVFARDAQIAQLVKTMTLKDVP